MHLYDLPLTGIIALCLFGPLICVGQETDATVAPAVKASDSTPGPEPTTYEGPGPQPEVGAQEETAVGETWGDKSYVIPFFEVITFIATLNLYDREFEEEGTYDTTFSTFEDNLTTVPEVDSDTFQINQLYHPYQGAMYFGFARSAGLGYWHSLLYSIGGSELWETAGETSTPSFNDHIASGIGGSFFGEPLFRMASLLLEGGGANPGLAREIGAAIISPPTGINRLLFGERFDKIYPSHNPPTFIRLRLGYSTKKQQSDNSESKTYSETQVNVDFLLSYGLPGKSGYTYDRPFDYFNFEFAAGTGNSSFQNIMSRGLLFGTDYEWGDAYRGIWGLYGSYDYISPEDFRVSSTALSVGTTYQWWLMQDVALQGTTLGGVGYAAAGTIQDTGERDYRYGTTPQGLLAFRLIYSDRAMLDMNGRVYYISDVYGSGEDGHELIQRGNIGFTVRVYNQHALGLQFTATTRDAESIGSPDRYQSEEIASIVYTVMGDSNFGAVDW